MSPPSYSPKSGLWGTIVKKIIVLKKCLALIGGMDYQVNAM